MLQHGAGGEAAGQAVGQAVGEVMIWGSIRLNIQAMRHDMKCFLRRSVQVCLLIFFATTAVGCWGLGEGIHTSRDEGKSTSRFRYEYEMIPNAVVMREDTEPRWQLGRYVFVRGADKVLVISRITSWSDTATKKQRESGDIPDMKDQILERLWITIPQATAVGQELDLHALSYRFMASYDRGIVGDAQFARPFRVLGNVRVLSEEDGKVHMRIRIRLTTDQTTAWEIFENDIVVPDMPDGRYAKQATPDAVIYPLSRPGEVPTTGMTPVKVTPEMTGPSVSSEALANPAGDANNSNDAPAGQTPAANQAANPAVPPAMTDGKAEGKTDANNDAKAAAEAGAEPPVLQADGKEYKPENETAALAGKWYSRTPARELFVQLNPDSQFVISIGLPATVPAVIKGEWRLRSGYVVLHIKSMRVGKDNQMALRKDNPYAMLKLHWTNENTVVLNGDLPSPTGRAGRYEVRRADYPDMLFIPAQTYIPNSPEPRYIGEAPAGPTDKAQSVDQPVAPDKAAGETKDQSQ